MAQPERIRELEEELQGTKYNKRTQKAVGVLKAKIAQLREKQERRGSGKGAGSGYAVSKSGDATVVLLGFPSVGKSTLLNALTGAQSAVGAYAFTTLTVIPGLLEHRGAKIQILDVPGVLQGAAAGTGRGKEVLAVIRNADLVLLLLDVFHPGHLPVLLKEVHDTNIRINVRKPDVNVVRKERGGLDLGVTVKLTQLERETIEAILREFRVVNAQVVVREDVTADELIDVLEGNRVYLPAIVAVDKIDLVSKRKLLEVMRATKADIAVSGETKENIEALKELIFQKLRFIRIYTKEARKDADMDVPLIIRSGATVEQVCMKLHKDFVKKFRFARVWGKSAKFAGQKFGMEHALKDGDVVEVHVR